MPKPTTVRLPGGGKIIPEHFHEGTAERETFERAVRDALSAPHKAVTARHAALQAKRKRQRAKSQIRPLI